LSGEAIAFYLLALLVAGSAFGCVIARNIVRMALCLLGTLGRVALLYFLLSASFLGVIQLIVYAGGTLVVIVFGVMLTAGPRACSSGRDAARRSAGRLCAWASWPVWWRS